MNLWDQILSRVETKVNRHSFYTWFKPTSFVGEDAAAITVRVPNGLFKDWLTKHYSGVISEALGEVRKGSLAVNFVADPPAEDEEGGGRGRGGPPTAPMAVGVQRFTWDLQYAPVTPFQGMVLWGATTNGPIRRQRT